MTTDVLEEPLLTSVEWKTLGNALILDKCLPLLDGELIRDRCEAILRIIEEYRIVARHGIRDARDTFARLKSSFKTPVAAYYVKLIALRSLLRVQGLLCQKLASSAPVERLILRNRPRQLYAARPPIAPPHFA